MCQEGNWIWITLEGKKIRVRNYQSYARLWEPIISAVDLAVGILAAQPDSQAAEAAE